MSSKMYSINPRTGRRRLKLNKPKLKPTAEKQFKAIDAVAVENKYTDLYICDNIDKIKNVPMTQILTSKKNNPDLDLITTTGLSGCLALIIFNESDFLFTHISSDFITAKMTETTQILRIHLLFKQLLTEFNKESDKKYDNINEFIKSEDIQIILTTVSRKDDIVFRMTFNYIIPFKINISILESNNVGFNFKKLANIGQYFKIDHKIFSILGIAKIPNAPNTTTINIDLTPEQKEIELVEAEEIQKKINSDTCIHKYKVSNRTNLIIAEEKARKAIILQQLQQLRTKMRLPPSLSNDADIKKGKVININEKTIQIIEIDTTEIIEIDKAPEQILQLEDEYYEHIKVGDIVYIYEGILYPEKPYIGSKRKSKGKRKSNKGKRKSTKGKRKSTKGKRKSTKGKRKSTKGKRKSKGKKNIN
jgi:hypothetical protein